MQPILLLTVECIAYFLFVSMHLPFVFLIIELIMKFQRLQNSILPFLGLIISLFFRFFI